MKKMITTALVASAMGLAAPLGVAQDDVQTAIDDSVITVANNCNRLLHITATSGAHTAGVTIDVGETKQLDTVKNHVYSVQIFEGYYPLLPPHDVVFGVDYNANLNVVPGGLGDLFCAVAR